MTDLTEQWKKRTLPNGVYYIKLIGGDILPAFCNTEYVLKQFQTMKGIYDGTDIEVLAPVPSYEEWQNIINCACEEHEANNCLIEENEKLKELLKECSPYISHSATSRMIKNSVGHKKDMKLLTKIEQALGEDK